MDSTAALQGKGSIVRIHLQHFRGTAGTISVVDKKLSSFRAQLHNLVDFDPCDILECLSLWQWYYFVEFTSIDGSSQKVALRMVFAESYFVGPRFVFLWGMDRALCNGW